MLSAEASDTGVSAARRQFSQNDYPRVQRSAEPLHVRRSHRRDGDAIVLIQSQVHLLGERSQYRNSHEAALTGLRLATT